MPATTLRTAAQDGRRKCGKFLVAVPLPMCAPITGLNRRGAYLSAATRAHET